MKHVRACLSTKEDRENSFHHCGGPLRLVQDCLCAGKNCTSSEVEMALSGLSRTLTGLSQPHRAPTALKNALSIALALKQACTCFTAPPRRLQRRYQ